MIYRTINRKAKVRPCTFAEEMTRTRRLTASTWLRFAPPKLARWPTSHIRATLCAITPKYMAGVKNGNNIFWLQYVSD